MKTLKGDPIAKGVTMGRLVFITEEEKGAAVEKGEPEEELKRFEDAVETAQEQLGELYEKAVEEVGEEQAAIFEMHQALIEDEDFTDTIKELIEEGEEASAAVKTAGDQYAQMFADMDDDYMKERAVDIRDISSRIARILMGIADQEITEPSVIGAIELKPSQTMQMDRKLLLGFITRDGAANSHTAILARNLGIPAVSGIDEIEELADAFVIIDGNAGTVITDPDDETKAEYKKIMDKEGAEKEELKKLRDAETVTTDGRRIKLYANLDDIGDLDRVLDNGAEGVGLLRSEFLYLSSSDYPTEDQLFNAYKKAAEALDGRELIIRTLDIGADKQVDYFCMDHEENPAMGIRAIRLCFERPAIFNTQLRAILRAAAYGNVAVMFPMITGIAEVEKAKSMLDDARAQLKAEGIEAGDLKVGIMVETPAAVIMSEELAEIVDFFSIGTNDLTQYTLAMDRQNSKIISFFDAHHPAVLRSIETTVRNAHKHDCVVGICGELGGDPNLTDFFLNAGVDELSVSPSKILGLRKLIREM
ncbi:MAG: phosphoenolpyruvate--protein phosphotransferase [Lachnospiraceae bacterium]|nr:phosphoenolpyruvate--protein phosphotransferase [Lachnospiraceae bacterium]